jgi:hypothetical protein
MDYKPPPPLDVILTPDVLSKYQRIFSFILRLLRGEISYLNLTVYRSNSLQYKARLPLCFA